MLLERRNGSRHLRDIDEDADDENNITSQMWLKVKVRGFI